MATPHDMPSEEQIEMTDSWLQNIDDEEQPKLPKIGYDEATILLLGKTGCGKSSLVNALLGEKVAKVTHGRSSTPHEPIERHNGSIGSLSAKIIDTRGLCSVNQDMNQRKLIYMFKQCMQDEVDVVLICNPLFSREDPELIDSFKLLIECFGAYSDVWKKCVIVLTKGNQYKDNYYNIEEDEKGDCMMNEMEDWAKEIKKWLSGFGVNNTTIEQMPVCVTGLPNSLMLPVAKNWIETLLFICNSVLNSTPEKTKKRILDKIVEAKDIVVYNIKMLIDHKK